MEQEKSSPHLADQGAAAAMGQAEKRTQSQRRPRAHALGAGAHGAGLRHLHRMGDVGRMTNFRHMGLVGYLGGGPWMLQQDCPAPRHNTYGAAWGRHPDGPNKGKSGLSRCTCPRAMSLL